TADDFLITDQGKRQQIVMFRRNQAGPRPAATVGEHVYSNRAAGTRQATVILLDLLNASMADRGGGWEGVNRALEKTESGERVYLYLVTAEGRLASDH